MRCKNILIFSFLKGNGSGDAEVRGGASALVSKQNKRIKAGTATGVQVTTVVGPIKDDRYFSDYTPLLNYKEKDDVGVYMICHAGENSMTPTAKELANAMWEKLFLKGLDVKKMNLVACLAAGKQGGAIKDLDKSHLTEFCQELLRLNGELEQNARKLPDGLKVCGYARMVTIVVRKNGDEPTPWKTLGTVVAQPELRSDEEKWHPNQELQRKVFIKFAEGANKIPTTHPKGNELKLAGQQLESLEKHPAKKLAQRIQQITNGENVEALNALWSYLRCKRALKYNIITNAFDFCSMSEYTQNTDLSNLIKRLEVFMDPCEKQQAYHVLPPARPAASVEPSEEELGFDLIGLEGGQ
jgi:hypothetical protein